MRDDALPTKSNSYDTYHNETEPLLGGETDLITGIQIDGMPNIPVIKKK